MCTVPFLFFKTLIFEDIHTAFGEPLLTSNHWLVFVMGCSTYAVDFVTPCLPYPASNWNTPPCARKPAEENSRFTYERFLVWRDYGLWLEKGP